MVVSAATSKWKTMTFGVPLGSIFAPILFVYINDLTSMLQSDSYLFADHAKLLVLVYIYVY